MRHKYSTSALVVGRTPLGEANALMILLTLDVGLVRARAQGVRLPGAKLAASLLTFAESEVMLVRGVEGWRVTGATLKRRWLQGFSRAARVRAARVTGLVLRLTPPEAADGAVFTILQETFALFAAEPEMLHEAVECRALLRLLTALGLDTGDIPPLVEVQRERSILISRINRGITLSGL